MKYRITTSQAMRFAAVIILLVWSVGPVFVAFSTSLSTVAEINQQSAPIFPRHPNFQNYAILLSSDSTQASGASLPYQVKAFRKSLGNTAVATLATVVTTLVICISAGYAFNRLRFPGRQFLLYAVIITLPIPAFALLAPLFRIVSDLKLIDTYPGLVLVYLSSIGPLVVWLFYNYVGDLSIEPEEAALVDGCNRFQAFIYVVLPQMVPGLAAITAITMLSAWGQFLLPLLFAPTLATKPVTVSITELTGKYTTSGPLISAAGMLALIPPALVALLLNRYIRDMLSGFNG
jgi:multiple sugar transport system permease protein